MGPARAAPSRASIPRARVAAASHPPISNEFFRTTKKDKLTIKHNALMAKVRDAGISKAKRLKRRRPASKLSTDVADLGDALPEVAEQEEWDGFAEEIAERDEGLFDPLASTRVPTNAHRRHLRQRRTMQLRSLKLGPGAMKRRHTMERVEQERFAKNLESMLGVKHSQRPTTGVNRGGDAVQNGTRPTHTPSQSERWAALRSFISSNMEKDASFVAPNRSR